jgi:hypothetical protein
MSLPPSILPWEIIDADAAWSEFQKSGDRHSQQAVTALFDEQEVIGRSRHTRIIACSLYFKPSSTGMEWGIPSFEAANRIRVRSGAQTWWDVYADPLLRNLHTLLYVRPDADVHLYLASDMTWMIKYFKLPQVVIHLMAHTSIAASPGTMWRFLAHDLPGIAEVQFSDIEDGWDLKHVAQPLSLWRNSDLALFRHLNPHEWDPHVADLLIYRPLGAGSCSMRPQADFSMRRACVAFTWLALQGRIPTRMRHPLRGDVEMFGHHWPNYGFDESFLQHAVYPFFLDRGVFTSYTYSASDALFKLDLAAAFHACPRSIVTRNGNALHVPSGNRSLPEDVG